jgi:protein-S-isoprenylcysteine O-methyltransferase Ste14
MTIHLILRQLFFVLIAAAMVFIPAGSLNYWEGWTWLACTCIPVSAVLFYFSKNDPKLIERRLQTKEKVTRQKLLIRWFKGIFIAVLLVPGLDRRFGWSRAYFGGVPWWLVLLSDGLLLGGIWFVFWVLRVNSFAGRTIRVEPGQPVIASGPYGIVRHPMYLGSIVMLLATPLALGSYSALPLFALLVPFYVLRLLNEEKVLGVELPGYPEYCRRTRFHLVPLIW